MQKKKHRTAHDQTKLEIFENLINKNQWNLLAQNT